MMTQQLDGWMFTTLMQPLGPFEPRPHLAVAVSGGADSLALLLLLRDWVQERQGQLTALSVDHGLRPEAAAECREVGQMVAGLNAAAPSNNPVAHDILTWQGEKPSRGLMAAARAARYRLLAGWCLARDVLHLALAHHADDQAETVLMREAHGSGAIGLAGMSGLRELQGIRLLRPLLPCRKSALAGVVQQAGLTAIDDPSNRARRFERVRWRDHLRQEADIAELQHTTWAAGTARDAIERGAASLLAQISRLDPAGYATIDLARLMDLEDDLMGQILRQVLMTIGGADFPAAPTAISRLITGLRQARGMPLTLAGCLLAAGGNELRIFREPAACDGPVSLMPGQTVIWDRRFAVTLSAGTRQPQAGFYAGGGAAGLSDQQLHVAAIGERGLANKTLPARLVETPHLARASLPGLWQGKNLLGVGTVLGRANCQESEEIRAGEATYRLDVSFRPAQPASSSGFTVVLPPRHTM
jgi:tRNA(Ile)-lysidine synthase